MTDDTTPPTKPGWYRVRWQCTDVADYLPQFWVCAHVQDVTNRGCTAIRGLAVYSFAAKGLSPTISSWVSLDNIAEWGGRVDMPGDTP